jgi:hypothetical protein
MLKYTTNVDAGSMNTLVILACPESKLNHVDSRFRGNDKVKVSKTTK